MLEPNNEQLFCLHTTPPAALEGGLSSSTVLLPVPSPEKGGGFVSKVSNLPTVKQI